MSKTQTLMALAALTDFTQSLLASHGVELCYDGVDPDVEGTFFKTGEHEALAQAIENSNADKGVDTVHLTVSDDDGVLGGISIVNHLDSDGQPLGAEIDNWSDQCKTLVVDHI